MEQGGAYCVDFNFCVVSNLYFQRLKASWEFAPLEI